MSEDAIDLKYAKEVADYIGSDHTEVIINKDRVLESLEEVVSSWYIRYYNNPRQHREYLVCKAS